MIPNPLFVNEQNIFIFIVLFQLETRDSFSLIVQVPPLHYYTYVVSFLLVLMAFKKLQEQIMDLILMNYKMPRMDGCEACIVMRKGEAVPYIRIFQ